LIQLIRAAAAADGVAVVGAVLWLARSGAGGDRRGGLGAGRLLGVLVLSVLTFAIKASVLLVVGLSIPFGVFHLLYLELVVVVPLLGAALLWVQRARPLGAPRALTSALAVVTCLLAPVGVYASFVEPFRLQLEKQDVSVSAERDGQRPVRIGVLADIQTRHVSDYEYDAIERLMAESPDVILLPGDLHQGERRTFEKEFANLRRLVGHLAAPGGVYFVLGDVDSRRELERLFAGTRVRLLVNQVARTTVRGRRIAIGGTELGYRSAAARRVIAELERVPGRRDIRILLSHRPDSVLLLPPNPRTDLVVAGHTHGGQVQLPWLGPPIKSSRVPRSVAAGGLHAVGTGRRIYVSRGVGMERGQAPRLRLGAPPEVSLLRLIDR
jgi:uncharacterized protein